MKKSLTIFFVASIALMSTACGGNTEQPEATTEAETIALESSEATEAAASGASSFGSNSYQAPKETDSDFEEFLKENDPDSYNSYQTLEDNWNSGNWDPENGFFGETEEDSGFEEYLKENDPDSYDFYQQLEDNWKPDSWSPEYGFFGG